MFFLFFSYIGEPIFSQNLVLILQIVLGSYPAGNQEEVKFDPKEPSKEDPSPSSQTTLSNSSSDGLNVLV